MAREKPGVLLYFEIAEPLKMLDDSDRGRLFTAILEYAQFGVVPEFNGALGMCWAFIRPKLDVDECRYKGRVLQNRYAASKRWNDKSKDKRGWKPLPEYEIWLLELAAQGDADACAECERMQLHAKHANYNTTTTSDSTASTDTKSNSNSISNTKTDSAATPSQLPSSVTDDDLMAAWEARRKEQNV